MKEKMELDLNYYKALCLKAVLGNISRSEETKLNLWLNSKKNKEEFEKIKNIWVSSSPPKIPEIPDIDLSWAELNNQLDLSNTEFKEKVSKWDSIYSSIEKLFAPKWKPVFAGVLIAIIFASSILLLNTYESSPQFVKVSTQNKEHNIVKLSDGTLVTLNSASILEYPEKFSETVRTIKLDGEAFFKVTKDTRPFKVITDNAVTSVLGTEFNVWARDEKTRVIVKEGLVNLSSSSATSKGVYISKDQSSTVTKNENPNLPISANSDKLLGWLEGKLVFDQTPLNEIIDELQRHYDVKLSLGDDALIDYSLTGSFKNSDADSALSMICLALNLDLIKNNQGYLIKSKK